MADASDFELNSMLDDVARSLPELHRVGRVFYERVEESYVNVSQARIKRRLVSMYPDRYLVYAHMFARRWVDLANNDWLSFDIPIREQLIRRGTDGCLYGVLPHATRPYRLEDLTLIKPPAVTHVGETIDIERAMWTTIESIYESRMRKSCRLEDGDGAREAHDIIKACMCVSTCLKSDEISIVSQYVGPYTGYWTCDPFSRKICLP